MKNMIGAFLVFAFVVLPFNPQTVFAGVMDDLKNEAGALMSENKQLDTERAQLDAIKQTLTTDLNLLKMRDAEIKQKYANMTQEKIQIESERTSIESSISHYNSYCHGEFTGEEYRRRKAWCDANLHPINSRHKNWKQVRENYNKRGNAINEERQKMSNDTLAWSKKVKALDGQYQDLEQKRQNWHIRFQNLQSQSLIRLKQVDPASKECASIPGVGEWSTNISGPSERAHRCLQRIWDGAN
jgi:chromosome segregation ATPase